MCGGTARPVHLRRVLRWQSALDPTRGAEHHDGERFLSERVPMRILLVEDQKKLAAHIARGLAEDGHIVDSVHDGDVACDQGEAVAYDVIVLDWSLPGRDGLSVLRHWRQRGLRTPVLMLTARATLEERVLALRTGADDHLSKPFAYDELLARVEALHRRAGHGGSRELGDITLDSARRAVRRGDAEAMLTTREWALMTELCAHRGEVCTRSQLLSTVWGQDFDGAPNVVDVYIGYLRQKLQAVGAVTTSIATVRGAGYRLDFGGSSTTAAAAVDGDG